MTSTAQSAPAWLRRLGVINDYVRIPYANGSSFASQFLYREMSARNREVTIVGPEPSRGTLGVEPPEHIALWALPLRNHPGVNLPLPTRADLARLHAANFDMIVSHSCSALQYAGVWLRQMRDVPMISVNTVHLPSVYNSLLPDSLLDSPVARLFDDVLVPWVESHTVHIYNESDVLVVLCEGMARYWRELGVTAPIRVIGRAIDTRVFDRPAGDDPFDDRAPRGGRLLVACRHVREKGVDILLRTFARLAPQRSELTLTLVGDGPDHDGFKKLAADLGIADRCFFVGERSQLEMPGWYRHADLFIYASLSETFGQVVGEALWCGLPVVAYDDGRGVSAQVTSGIDGELVTPSAGRNESDDGLEHAVGMLIDDLERRRAAGEEASRRARLRADPNHILPRYFEAFEEARAHNRRRRRPSSAVRAMTGLSTLSRWASVHAVTLTAGLMRPPSIVNRHDVAPPPWALASSEAPEARITNR